jgi:type IV secretion system protein VirB2
MSIEREDWMKRLLSRVPLAGTLLLQTIVTAAAQSSGGTLQPVNRR